MNKVKQRYFNVEKQERECSKCGEIKPFTDFSLDKPTGLPRAKCKKCQAIDAHEYNKTYKLKFTKEEYNEKKRKRYTEKQLKACQSDEIKVDKEAAEKYMQSKKRVGLI